VAKIPMQKGGTAKFRRDHRGHKIFSQTHSIKHDKFRKVLVLICVGEKSVPHAKSAGVIPAWAKMMP